MSTHEAGSHRAANAGRRNRLRRATTAVMAIAALALLAPTASATIGMRDRYHDEWSFSHDDCGWTVDVTGEADGDFFVRIGKGEFESAFWGHDNFAWTETHVRESDGATILITANGLTQETKATHVDGTVYRFSAINAGQLFVFRTADGRKIAMDRGNISNTILFDTLGDAVPGGAFIDLLSIRFAGRYDAGNVDYCALFDQ